ncbi:Degenerin mec-4 like protein [Argiope bruennichi]|uniref:Degenerin mec-4 like protein n=1 Tax=Argiope bruennichi TaxID=94029 RepID=A0A8T0FSE4_ARGBR|nr:Degenerin mec-4 like protein [Argiope bruennichi]
MRRGRLFLKRSYWTRFCRHAKKILEKSAIAGVPQIVAANNPILKLLRAAVFFSCLFGFLYQFFTFLQLYWAYPIVMDVQVKSPSKILVPAFTICDHNGYTLKNYCSITKHKCVPVLNDTEFCLIRRRYCHRRKLPPGFMIPPDQSLIIHEIMNGRNATAIPEIPQNHMIKNCEMLIGEDAPTTTCSKARKTPYTKGDIVTRTNCLMFNSIWDLPGATIQDMPSTTVINLLLLTNKTDYFPQIGDQFVAMYIDFHSPMTLTNPFVNGFIMYPGMRYKYYIKERILKLLPAPYSTNCTDYLTEWKKNGNKGPISLADCIEYCKLELIRKQRKCVDFFNFYPHNEPLCETGCKDFVCSSGYKDVDGMSESLTKFGKICAEKCRPGCDQKVYEITKEEIQVPEEVFAQIPDRHSWKQYIYVRLSFDKFDITTYSYTPKFELIETFCYLGGYVGIWLGISLVAVFDFVESIIIILKHPYRRMRNKFRTKVHPIVSQEERILDRY